MNKQNAKIIRLDDNITADSSNPEIRKYFIDTALNTIRYMQNKVYNGRIRNEEHEKIKTNQLKLVINACNVGNRILKDAQYDEIQKDLKELKDGLLIEASSENVIVLTPETIKEIEDIDDKLTKIKKEEGEWRNGESE